MLTADADSEDWRTMMAMLTFLGDPRPAWAKREVHGPGCRGDEWEVTDSHYEPATPENHAIRDSYSYTSKRQPCTCGLRTDEPT